LLWPVMTLTHLLLVHHELFVVPRILGSPRPASDEPPTGAISVVGNFGPKAEYVSFEHGSRTSRRRLKKPALLDVPSDANM
jgi:hypothetical protein